MDLHNASTALRLVIKGLRFQTMRPMLFIRCEK